ncbi:UDP-glucosyltransferase 2-like [Coccinella septempunctata]|uniref:UDP-glucosyltransferase 2-like n=1 Tax=Coccinella septempunctata TaxID=41139 RepID=UPI001D091C94|nr:UDP-glucosyltransferase 2-like [Coccinella septempunctata]
MRCLVLFLCVYVGSVHNAKVLSIFPMHSHSHFTLGFNLLQEMAKRGHEITFISPYPQEKPLKNLRDISIASIKPALDELKKELFRLENVSPIDNFRYMSKMGRAFTELGLASEEVQNLLKSNETFDLILIEHFFNEAQFALGHHFKAPVVLLSPMPSSILNNHLFANPSPSSYVHNLFAPFTQYMTLSERLMNFYYDTMMTIYQYYDELPAQKRIMEKFFPNAPPFEEILYNSSLLLMNSHPSFSDPVPHMANIIEIGGYHVLPPKKLPHDLHKYLNESKNGVVYFSMGSILKSHVLTEEKRRCFIQAFSKLKQDVLWKFDVDIEGLPPNVKILKWAPQNEILAHPNVKLFVTHGGLLSTIETIYHGIPTIGIPVFSDQKFNIAASEKFGYAIKVPFDEITEEKLTYALNEILNNPKYKENAKRRSAIMRDQQVKPIDKAIYWIEYVIRHKGAHHLHSAALDLEWYQRSMLDVLAIITLTVFTLIYILITALKVVFNKTPVKRTKQKKQ